MTDLSKDVSTALFQSLLEAPLLVGDLPEAPAFDNRSLLLPKDSEPLDLRQKLGYLYEDALAVVLEATPRYDLLERGIQIRKRAGHTLGEIDFLVRDLSSSRLIHLELAVKFYLALETGRGFLLPGPDARDNYFRKLEKMRSHQLTLVSKYRDLLPENFHDEEIGVRQLVHGCIFEHVNANRPVVAESLNPEGRRGKWLHAGECAGHFGKDTRLEIIPKPLWPVPLEKLEGLELEKWTGDGTIDRCVMVRPDGGSVPYFIAPNGYPGRDAAAP